MCKKGVLLYCIRVQHVTREIIRPTLGERHGDADGRQRLHRVHGAGDDDCEARKQITNGPVFVRIVQFVEPRFVAKNRKPFQIKR